MAKHMEAFFKTENDAESAKSELQKFSVEQEMVEAVPEDTDMAPIVPIGSANTTSGGTFDFTEVLNPDSNRDSSKSDKRHLTHILHFRIKEEEYDQAIAIIKNHDGHMNKSDL